jgi:hypothetical protein
MDAPRIAAKVVPFPARRPESTRIASGLESVGALLVECGRRQIALRDDGRRLADALGRLNAQLAEMAFRQSRLGRSLRRLRALGERARRPGPGS